MDMGKDEAEEEVSNISANAKYLEEDEVSQECKELIATLPAEKGWVVSYMYQYQGFWNPSRHLQGILSCQRHFRALDSDVLLITTPKAGTIWLKSLLFCLLHRPDHHHPLLTTNPHDLVPFLELRLYVDKDVVPDLSAVPPPRLFASHIPLSSLPPSVMDSSCKIVYLCRNPKDTFVSLFQFTNKLRPKERGTNELNPIFDKFCRGVSIYGPFWDHVLDYWKASLEEKHKVLFIKYEDMKKRPAFHLNRMAEFLDCPFSAEEERGGVVDEILKLCSFDNLSNLEVNRKGKLVSGEENKAFFRKGEIGDWKNYLTDEMIRKLDRITEEKLHAHGLKF